MEVKYYILVEYTRHWQQNRRQFNVYANNGKSYHDVSKASIERLFRLISTWQTAFANTCIFTLHRWGISVRVYA